MEEINLIHISPVSATFEILNDSPYRRDEFDVILNGNKVLEGETKNVFTLFNLKPNTKYTAQVLGKTFKFTTLAVNRIIDVCEYGVKPDGKTNNKEAIQKILDECDHDLIVFKKGTYYTSPLQIRSNTYIYIQEDAEILASNDRADYPIIKAIEVKDGKELVAASWEGEPNDSFMSVITAVDAENIMIVGEGTINGNADNADWWIDCKTMRGAWRPNNIFTNRCKNFDMIGLNVVNSACWNIHPFYSDNLNFINLYVKSVYTSPNTDGIDPESCDNVNIIGDRICVGDDCIAIKSGKYIMSEKWYKPCSNIVIRNCYMGDGHGAIVFGSESSCGIIGCDVSRCIFEHTDRGFRIKTKRGRGKKAIVENVSFDNIYMHDVKNALVVNMYYYLSFEPYVEEDNTKEYVEVNDMTPHLGSFKFKNMKCLNTKISAGYFYGLPESKIDEIDIENIEITYDKGYKHHEEPAMIYEVEKLNKAGFYFYNVEKVNLKNIKIKGQNGEVINAFNCDEINSLD